MEPCVMAIFAHPDGDSGWLAYHGEPPEGTVLRQLLAGGEIGDGQQQS